MEVREPEILPWPQALAILVCGQFPYWFGQQVRVREVTVVPLGFSLRRTTVRQSGAALTIRSRTTTGSGW